MIVGKAPSTSNVRVDKYRCFNVNRQHLVATRKTNLPGNPFSNHHNTEYYL